MSPRLRLLPALAILLPLILACNLFETSTPQSLLPPTPAVPTDMPAAAQLPPATPVPPVTYQPYFEQAPCAFPVPAGTSPECGYLVVPENRAIAGGPTTRLHTAIFRNRTGAYIPDAVIHLAGGPGSSSLGSAAYLFSYGMQAVLDRHDLILFDQRGTGYSQPRLDCPEREQLAPVLLEGNLPVDGSQQLVLDAFRRCRERLVSQGIDLSTYNSAASAADLNDLRLALGYEKLDLYAVSYGTRLALTLMRDHPEAVRSAVLDSVYPLQVNLYTSLAPNAQRAFDVFFTRCELDAGCSAAYPDLRSVFFQLVDQLNLSPLAVSLSSGGVEHSVRLDGGLLVDVLFTGLYNPAVTSSMPAMIFDIRAGNFDILRNRLALYFEHSSALGMQMSVQCNEELPFEPVEAAYEAAQGVQSQIAAYYLPSVQPLFDACREWTSAAPDPRENLPVASDVPALVLAGDGDPITPPDWGRAVSADLSHSYFHEFPGSGHWVTRSSGCALRLSLAFWDDPAQDPGWICQ